MSQRSDRIGWLSVSAHAMTSSIAVVAVASTTLTFNVFAIFMTVRVAQNERVL